MAAMSNLVDIGRIFDEVLQRHRTRQNIAQGTLAWKAGVDRTFVSRLERGIRQPTLTTLINLGLALGVPTAELVAEAERAYLKQCRQGQ